MHKMLSANDKTSKPDLTSRDFICSASIIKQRCISSFNRNLIGIASPSLIENFLTNPAGLTDGLGFSSNVGTADFLSPLTSGFLTASHSGQQNTIIADANINDISHKKNLWNRSWLLQKKGGNATGNITMNFNFHDYNKTSPTDLYYYSILYNATSGTFSSGTNIIVSIKSINIFDNTVSFVVTADNLLNGFYTIIWSKSDSVESTKQV